MFARIDAWAVAHPWWTTTLVLVLFFFVTGLANWATFPDDDKEWERIQRDEPRRAGMLLVLRGWGFYPAKTLKGLVALVLGRFPGGGSSKPPTLPPGIGGLFVLVVLALSLFGCAWMTPARGAAAAELAGCVFQHWGEPPDQIALECGADVVDVMRVQKAATRYGVSPKCGAP